MDEVRRRLEAVRRSRPEWAAWIRRLEETLAESEEATWRDGLAVDLPGAADPRLPRLAGGVIGVPARRARRFATLVARAAGVTFRVEDLAAVLTAVVNQDVEAFDAAFLPVANLMALPVLRAAGVHVARGVPATWSKGHCPVCGAWPLMAELRGLERARRLRCGRCAADWGFDHVRCPFCGTDDHEVLRSLADGESRKADTCAACRGYLKARTTLGPWSAAEILVEDLESVDLDLVAIERGFHRPTRPAVLLGARIVER